VPAKGAGGQAVGGGGPLSPSWQVCGAQPAGGAVGDADQWRGRAEAPQHGAARAWWGAPAIGRRRRREGVATPVGRPGRLRASPAQRLPGLAPRRSGEGGPRHNKDVAGGPSSGRKTIHALWDYS